VQLRLQLLIILKEDPINIDL